MASWQHKPWALVFCGSKRPGEVGAKLGQPHLLPSWLKTTEPCTRCHGRVTSQHREGNLDKPLKQGTQMPSRSCSVRSDTPMALWGSWAQEPFCVPYFLFLGGPHSAIMIFPEFLGTVSDSC